MIYTEGEAKGSLGHYGARGSSCHWEDIRRKREREG
jgi:hypothetical protein